MNPFEFNSPINFEEYYNWAIYDFTNDFVLAKIKKKETGEVKYVAFDKYTGKFVYEIKADIYFDYDTCHKRKYRKDGKSVIYSLDDDHVKEIFEKGCEHIEEV